MFLQVFNRALKKDGIIFRLAEHAIAIATQNTPDYPRVVTVVNGRTTTVVSKEGVQTYRALIVLTIKNHLKFIYRNTKHATQMIVAQHTLTFCRRTPTLMDFFAGYWMTLIAIRFNGVLAITSQGKFRSWFCFFTPRTRFFHMKSSGAPFRFAHQCVRKFLAFFTLIASVIATNTTVRCELPRSFITWLKAINWFDLLALGALFFGGYSGLSHAFRISITNSVIRLGQKFAASVRADPILSRISRNLNNFMTLCVCAAAAARMDTILSSEKGETLCLS